MDNISLYFNENFDAASLIFSYVWIIKVTYIQWKPGITVTLGTEKNGRNFGVDLIVKYC